MTSFSHCSFNACNQFTGAQIKGKRDFPQCLEIRLLAPAFDHGQVRATNSRKTTEHLLRDAPFFPDCTDRITNCSVAELHTTTPLHYVLIVYGKTKNILYTMVDILLFLCYSIFTPPSTHDSEDIFFERKVKKMKKALSLLLSLALMLSLVPAAHAAGFSDVTKDAWYAEAVDYVVSNKLMSGYSGTEFGPDDNLSRAMVVQVLYNKEGQPAVSDKHGFNDVSANDWFNNAVTWGTQKGVMSGYGGGKFAPNDNVTLEQIAVILWNYSGNPSFSAKADSVGEHSSWAANGLGWAVENELLKNIPYKAVTEGATRAQTAQMLTNYLTGNAGVQTDAPSIGNSTILPSSKNAMQELASFVKATGTDLDTFFFYSCETFLSRRDYLVSISYYPAEAKLDFSFSDISHSSSIFSVDFSYYLNSGTASAVTYSELHSDLTEMNKNGYATPNLSTFSSKDTLQFFDYSGTPFPNSSNNLANTFFNFAVSAWKQGLQRSNSGLSIQDIGFANYDK